MRNNDFYDLANHQQTQKQHLPASSGTNWNISANQAQVALNPRFAHKIQLCSRHLQRTRSKRICFVLARTKTDKCANVSIPVLNSHTSESSSCSTSSGLMGAATGQAGPAGTYQMEPINPSSYQHGKTLVWYCHPKPCFNSILYQQMKF